MNLIYGKIVLLIALNNICYVLLIKKSYLINSIYSKIVSLEFDVNIQVT